MNDDEIKCLCEPLSKANREITTLKCKCFGLEKENERLTNRVDLLENRPFPQHYDWRVKAPMFGLFNNKLDMYTLECLYCEIIELRDRLKESDTGEPAFCRLLDEILGWLWNKLDDDSRDWLSKNKKEYYRCE